MKGQKVTLVCRASYNHKSSQMTQNIVLTVTDKNNPQTNASRKNEVNNLGEGDCQSWKTMGQYNYSFNVTETLNADES